MSPIKTATTDYHGDSLGLVDRAVVAGLMALMVCATLAFGSVEPLSLATLELLIISFLVLLGIKGAFLGRMRIVIPATTLPLIALLSLAILQSFYFSLDAEATRLAAEVLLVLIIAFLISTNLLGSQRVLPWLINFLIFFGFALAVFGLIQRFTWNGKFFWLVELRSQPPSPFGSFINHNNFAGFVEMIAPIPLVLILRRVVRGGVALLYGFATAMMGLAIVMSLSRGGMISLVASLMFVIAFGFNPSTRPRQMRPDAGARAPARRWRRLAYPIPLAVSRVCAMIVILFTIGAGVWWVGADNLMRSVDRSELSLDASESRSGKETFFQSRGWIWRDTAAMIRANWLTGVGLGAYQTAYPIYSASDGAMVTSQAHNDYLQIMADGGIFGAIIALWFIFLIGRDTVRASRNRNPKVAATALGAASGLFALMVHSLFDFNLQIPSNTLLFLVLVSVISQIAANSKRSDGAISGQAARNLRMRTTV